MGFTEFATSCEEFLERLDRLNIRVPEDSALIGLAYDLVPRVTRLLREGSVLLTEIEDHYSAEEDNDPASLEEIGLQISWEFARRDLHNLVFFARTELRTALERLVAATTRQAPQMTVASLCESGLTRLRKALVSVESALYEFEGLEPPQRRWLDLKVSLQIRRLYWNLRRETLGRHPRTERSLETRLRSAIYRIVAFRELSVYPFLRVEDRVYLRQLLKRMLEWLNSHRPDPLVGQKIWDDLAAFAEILFEVSNREELQDHDREIVNRVHRHLFDGAAPPAGLPEELLDELRSLLGLDPDLDQLILSPASRPAVVWRAPLERLRDSLRTPIQSLDVDDAPGGPLDSA